VYYLKSEFDEDESNSVPPQPPQPDHKESELELPDDLKLDDAEAGADEDNGDTAADDVEGGTFMLIDW